jgi:hypothetical protein
MRTLAQLASILPLVLLLVAVGARYHPTTTDDLTRVALLSRLSIDLVGVPPTPEEIAAFLKDPRPDAVEQQIDRLLETPAFAERWGKHWLEIARAEDKDPAPAEVQHRYREWVIQAFNADVPLDQFIRERIAGKKPPE